MLTNGKEPRKKCAAIASGTEMQCRQPALSGSEFCVSHGGGAVETNAAPKRNRSGPQSGSCLRDQIEQMSLDPDLLHEIRTGVAAIKALLDEHLAALDAARLCESEDTAEEYSAALESHGKRIQSLAGDLFAAIDRITRVEERKKSLLSPEEAKLVLARLKSHVIGAINAAQPGERPDAIALKAAAAFESFEI